MGCVLYCAVVAALLPVASAAFDYQNFLDENIATYILIGIAVIYFSFTAALLLLALCYCCRQHKPYPLPSGQFERAPSAKKQPLPTIPEAEEPPHTQHKRGLTRLRSDEEGLIGHDGPSEPTTPIDTAPPPPQPVSVTPDPRRKKIAQEQPTDCGRVPPRLPGAASPLEKTPEVQRKTLPRVTHKTQLPPLRNTPPLGRKLQGEGPTEGGGLGPIHRVPNKRLESPRMQRRQKHTTSPPPDVAMGSLTMTTAATGSSAALEGLNSFVSELEIQQTPVNSKKKTHLDTSFIAENKGFSDTPRKVQNVLELQRQLKSLSKLWKQIGLEADLPKSILQLCGTGHSSEERLQKLCLAWLRKEPDLSWERVVEVLRGGELEGKAAEVAGEIQRRLCQSSTGGSPSSLTMF